MSGDVSRSSSSSTTPFLLELRPEELVDSLGLTPKFRGKQLFEWLHSHGSLSFEEMQNLPAALRSRLEEEYGAPRSARVVRELPDEDGTVKILVELYDGELIEAVLLEDIQGRKTACLSSQVGCALGCRFCRTSRMGLHRNLSAAEIVEQFYLLRDSYGKIDNIVFMGMGEPLANLSEVRKAVSLFGHEHGLGMSLRRITLSTSGLTDKIYDLAEKGPPLRLALSLVTADQDRREELIPVAVHNSLTELFSALETYHKKHKKRITLEYVVIRGINSSREDAEKLAEFARPLRAQVNIIPWNPVEELLFEEPSRKELNRFIDYVERFDVPVARRFTRGRGVNGACGQLAVE